MKKNKGITLIALLVTIVIMLILIGVSMKIVIDGNLFTSAQNAVDKTNNKVAQQQNIVNGLMDELAEIEKQQAISACTGHEWQDLDTITDATCTTTGSKRQKCNKCSATRIVQTAILGHNYVSGICTKCGEKEPLPAITAGTIATKTSEFTDTAGKKAVIPKGFTVSGIPAEQSIDGGLVIYDTEGATISTWTDSVKTEYNQFVWIPVTVNKSTDTETSIASFKRNVWQDNARVEDNTQSSTSFPPSSDSWSEYTEPYSYGSSDYDGTGTGKTGISSQITELTKSIYNYGGFWIGRYEAGSETSRTEGDSQTAAFVVQQDKYPYNWVTWGKGMGDISEGAVHLSNSLYTGKTGYGVKSMLCTGAAWDSMLDFIKDSSHNVTSSTSWGNHSNSETYRVYRGSLYSNSNLTWIAADTTNGSDVKKDTAILLTTGATERNSSKNIYDVAGNCFEWTTEANHANYRVLRGGNYSNYGSYRPASNRSISNPVNVSGNFSFRPLLYVTL